MNNEGLILNKCALIVNSKTWDMQIQITFIQVKLIKKLDPAVRVGYH